MIEPILSDDAFMVDVEAATGSSGLCAWWLGQSGFLLHSQADFVLMDPYLSDSLTTKYATTDKPHNRMSRRVVDPARLDLVNLITCSHGHTDHLDAETLRAVDRARGVNEDLLVAVPRSNAQLALERLGRAADVLLDAGESWRRVGMTINARCLRTRQFRMTRAGRSTYLGYCSS